jgi:hypothetical protein
MKARPQIAALAVTAGLILTGATISAPLAQASTAHVIENDQWGSAYSVTSEGLNKYVEISTGTDYAAIDGPVTVDGLTHVYQYEALTSSGAGTGLCLQLDTTLSIVVEGSCVDGNSRQQWDWNGTSGHLASIYEVEAGAADPNAYADNPGGYIYVGPECTNCITPGSYYSWDIVDG